MTDENIVFELRNETRVGDTVTFIIPGQVAGISVALRELINAKNGDRVSKMAAGMGNTIFDSACLDWGWGGR